MSAWIEVAKIAGGIIGGMLSGGLLVAILNRRKTSAEAQKLLAETGLTNLSGKLEILDRYSKFNQELLERMAKMELRIASLETEVHQLEQENDKLSRRCKALEEENRTLRRG